MNIEINLTQLKVLDMVAVAADRAEAGQSLLSDVTRHRYFNLPLRKEELCAFYRNIPKCISTYKLTEEEAETLLKLRDIIREELQEEAKRRTKTKGI